MLRQQITRFLSKTGAPAEAEAFNLATSEEGATAGGERLEGLSLSIAEIVEELEKISGLHRSLERVGIHVKEEFRARVKENARVAAMEVDLSNTRTALKEHEAEVARLSAQFRSSEDKAISFSSRYEETRTNLENAEREVMELHQAAAQAKEARERLEEELRKRDETCSDVSIALRSAQEELARQTKVVEELRAQHHALADEHTRASDRLVTVSTHLEESRGEAARTSQELDELKGLYTALRDQHSALEAKLSAAIAEAARLTKEQQALEGANRTRTAEIRLKLDEALSRNTRLEASREEATTELSQASAERTELRLQLGARDVSIGQLTAKVTALEGALDAQRVKANDVETARLTSVMRAESLNKELITVQGRLARAEATLQQKLEDAKEQAAADEEIKAGLTQKCKELQSVVAQQKSEIAMLRGAMDAVKKTRVVAAG